MLLLKSVEDLALEFSETAQDVDQGERPPLDHLKKLAATGYYRFVTQASPGQRRRALDLLSSGCGVTAFLSTQHEGVCRRLKEAGHPLLEPAVAGEVWVGVCFAHLRRTPSPVDAIEFRDHVVFSGFGPWFSGYGVMEKLVVGGATHDGLFLMGVASMDAPEIVVKPLPPLAVMNATATVGLDFNALQVDMADVVVRMQPDELVLKDMHSTVFQAARSLGAARGAARFLPRKQRDAVFQRLEEYHQRMDEAEPNLTWHTATGLRKGALSLARRVVGAAYVSVGGKAHLLTHPLQRISREASFYSTSQLTRHLRQSVIDELCP